MKNAKAAPFTSRRILMHTILDDGLAGRLAAIKLVLHFLATVPFRQDKASIDEIADEVNSASTV